MRNGLIKPQKSQTYEADEDQLLVADVVRHLLGLAKLYDVDKTGNTKLGEGLRIVAHALRPYSDCMVLELADAIKTKAPTRRSRKTPATKAKAQLPPTLESISQESIEEILKDGSYTKQQIAELGVRRFGISRSKLERLRKEEARESVRAAQEHEKSLDVISMEARRGGKTRST